MVIKTKERKIIGRYRYYVKHLIVFILLISMITAPLSYGVTAKAASDNKIIFNSNDFMVTCEKTSS